MSNSFESQHDTLADRLAKRRRLHHTVNLHKNSIDQSQVTTISSTTQSLDRKSGLRRTTRDSMAKTPIMATSMESVSSSIPSPTTHVSDRRKSSASSKLTNKELPPIENSSVRQNTIVIERLSDVRKTPSASVLPQIAKTPSVEHQIEHNSSSASRPAEKVLPIAPSDQLENLVLTEETRSPTEKLPTIPQNQLKSSETTVKEPEKTPIAIQTQPEPTASHVSPSSIVIPRPTTSSKPKTHARVLELAETETPDAVQHALSCPEATTNRQSAHFIFPNQPTPGDPMAPPVLPRASSDQPLTMAHRLQPRLNDRSSTRHNSLALAYLFNQRIIDRHFPQNPSSNTAHSPHKTAWD